MREKFFFTKVSYFCWQSSFFSSYLFPSSKTVDSYTPGRSTVHLLIFGYQLLLMEFWSQICHCWEVIDICDSVKKTPIDGKKEWFAVANLWLSMGLASFFCVLIMNLGLLYPGHQDMVIGLYWTQCGSAVLISWSYLSCFVNLIFNVHILQIKL